MPKANCEVPAACSLGCSHSSELWVDGRRDWCQHLQLGFMVVVCPRPQGIWSEYTRSRVQGQLPLSDLPSLDGMWGRWGEAQGASRYQAYKMTSLQLV
jgi:hypothetical protein